MGHGEHSLNSAQVAQIGSFRVSPAKKTAFAIFTLIGVAGFIFAAMTNPTRAWPNFLLNYFYFLALGLFGGFFVALQHITNAYWSVTVRRLAEGLLSYLPVALVLGLVLLFGKHHLYEWTHADFVREDHLLNLKEPYLNSTFFTIRFVVFFALWILLAYKMRKNSLAQDKTGEDRFTLSNIKLGSFFIPVFGISFTLMSFDLLMSLEPHWFSTIFGVYCFAGLFVSGLSLMAVLIIAGRKQGLFDGIVTDNHLHDVGKLMFAFTVFWAYIMFSQLMLQWYANLPEEITYYIRRFHGGWLAYAGALFFMHFILPFFALLPRGGKRSQNYLRNVAFIILIAQWMDCYFMVMPVFSAEGPVFGWIEASVFLGFLGIFGLSVTRFLESVPAVPVKDPRLAQCLAHNQ